MMKTYAAVLILFLSGPNGFSQVGEIKDNIRTHISSNSSAEHTSFSAGSGNDFNPLSDLFEGIFGYLLVQPFVYGQNAALEDLGEYPERLSLEAFSSFGGQLNALSRYFQTGIKGNWGIFAMDVRYENLFEPIEKLRIINWNILMLSIPIHHFKLEYGLGTYYILEPESSFFKQQLGAELRLPNWGLTLATSYQWSESNFRKAFGGTIDYEVYTKGILHISPKFEYSYQNFFGQNQFSIYSLGVVLRLF